ncbi:hydrolase [Archaeoglobus veneficus]|uniref:TIM-barrel protein n=1 Tax=Archaeoglobus veneficus (strain DSM 11195 / SNP6) TaxID=693661 RepID=F2KSG0_ARCVS|nr:hydrolase [Archaeoglobus veneficus]AEA46929.1 TIM-barrel protein [Archaeoglobus veneficus SNP6]
MRVILPNRLVLSAMAGINSAEFCMNFPAGLVILGGFNADAKAMEAAKRVVARGRREFLFDDPIKGIEEEVARIAGKKAFAVNVRSSSLDGYVEVADIVRRYGGIIEINAHCRQPEFIEAKCGQWLMEHPKELASVVREVSDAALTGVKLRNGAKCVEAARLAFKAGAAYVHVDAMIPGGLCDFRLVERISRLGITIGNNSVNSLEMAEKMAKVAHLVSAARAILKDPHFFHKLLASPKLAEPFELSG